MPTKAELELRIAELELQLGRTNATDISRSGSLIPSGQAERDPPTWPALSWRAGKTVLVWYQMMGIKRRIATLLVVVLTIVGVATPYISYHMLMSYRNYIGSDHIQTSIKDLGIIAVWEGDYSPLENHRLRDRIRNAKTIKFMGYNGGGFLSNEARTLEEFFNNKGKMQVLFADPDDPFFRETVRMQFKPDIVPEQIDKIKARLGESIAFLETFERDAGIQIEIRSFTNQMRMPMIIIDDEFCVLTLRLPPNEAKHSVRLEFVDVKDIKTDYIGSCIEHFDRVWAMTQDTARKVKPQRPISVW